MFLKRNNFNSIYDKIKFLPTMLDEVTYNNIYCATMQLGWNSLIEDFAKTPIVFNEKNKFVDNLNKKEFSKNDLNDKYYYVKCAEVLKQNIETVKKEIKEKFNYESNFLDNIKTVDEPIIIDGINFTTFFIYVLLIVKLSFKTEFDEIDNRSFKKRTFKNVDYFGIDYSTDDGKVKKLIKQIKIVFYDSEDDFAVYLTTKEGHVILINKAPKGKNFKEILDNIYKKGKKFKGNKNILEDEVFLMPKIEFDITNNFPELERKRFPVNRDIKYAFIEQVLQNVKFTLNHKGVELILEVTYTLPPWLGEPFSKPKPRKFIVDDTFVLYLFDKNSPKPYFAMKVDDITQFKSK